MKTFVLTGATSGIGLETARELLKLGHQVISPARSMEKAKKVREEVCAHTGNREWIFYEADFTDFKSVMRFAADIFEKYTSIDVLINNAGTWEVEFIETLNGIETNLQVNHLSPMLLTLEMMPLLLKSKEARIINTSSGAHRRNILNLHDLEFRNSPYNGIASYSQSKLLNLLFSLALSGRLKGTHITVNTVHPGYVQTALFNKMGQRDWRGVADASQGARSVLYAALSPDLKGVSEKYIYHEQDDPNISPLAKEVALAESVWDLSNGFLAGFVKPFSLSQ